MTPLDWQVFAGVLKKAHYHAWEAARDRYGKDIPEPITAWLNQLDAQATEAMQKAYGDKSW